MFKTKSITQASRYSNSVLINVYQATYGIIDRNFYLTGKMVWHPPPIVKTQLAMVWWYIESETMNSHQPGWKFLTAPMNTFTAAIKSAIKKPGGFWAEVEEDKGDEDVDEGDEGDEARADRGLSADDLGIDK
ncbi:hypothetical protein FRC10_002923 [Ceratobasidium sp. 414]|nr:hypothetical protein FRC10_002923 [Ceratobasidium sp. 414]